MNQSKNSTDGLDDGNYTYQAFAKDIIGNPNQTEERTITITSDIAPVVNIIFPQNINYTVDVTELNYSATDDNSISACWYSLDGGASNSSANPTCPNFTGLTSIEGSNTWTVYANDSAGQEASDSVTFTKDTVNPNVQFVSQTTATGNYSQNYLL